MEVTRFVGNPPPVSPEVLKSLYCNQDNVAARCLRKKTQVWFTFLGSGHQRNKEKLLSGLPSVAQEFTTGSVVLLTEIKHHIKTQYILGGKDKNTKRACLIFRNAILSFVSTGIQLPRLPSLFKSWRLYPHPIFCYFQGFYERAWAYAHVLHSIHTHQWTAAEIQAV